MNNNTYNIVAIRTKYSFSDTASEVESVHPQYGAPYIRTKANYTTKDNLLSLPRF